MQANETTFQRMVEGTKQFQVPLYQRPYSWGREELERLWDDLTEQAERDQETQAGGAAGHFLGSVVLAPGLSSASTLTRWLVIDGQQRLTSLSIALMALRDRLREVEELGEGDHSGADRINDVYLLNKYNKGIDKYRLLPTQADRAAYKAIVDEHPHAGGDDRVGFAYNFFSSKVGKYTEEDLLKIEETIGHRLSLVDIQAEAGDNVFRIFESLNNTGKGLSQTDLLRNYVFMLLPESGQEVYEEVWLPMQEELGPETLETLAWLDLVLRGDERAKQSEVYHGQKERLEKVPQAGGEKALRAEVEQLWRLGQLLQRVLDPGFEDDPELAEVLTRLESWGNTIYRPLALRLMVLRDQGHADTDDLIRALGYVESFLVRRMIAGVPTQGLNRIFTSSPKEIQPGGSIAESVHRYLSDPRRRWPSDKTLREAVAHRNFYWSGQALQRTFVLRRLEEAFDNPEPVDFGKAKVSIEHVMPQSMTEEWYEVLSKQTDTDETENELHGRLLHTLGNLTLTAQNSKLSNHLFERKQKIFQSSGLSMNRQIADAPSWGRPEIEARAALLADHACALWPAPTASGSREPEEIGADLARQIEHALAMLAADRWTTHRELAVLVGAKTDTVSRHLGAATDLTHRERVFKDTRAAEIAGADHEGFAPAAALAELVGLEVDEFVERERRFHALLLQNQRPDVVRATQALIDEWTAVGGGLVWGAGADTSCFLLTWDESVDADWRWALVLYPSSGRAEVVFQYMARRPPFDDVALRRELLHRFNAIPGVDLPEDSLNRRPSFPLQTLLDDGGRPVFEVLLWFRERCQDWLDQQV
ncbi:DUF262 domain-containing protein [Nocardiopsis sp. JB363]|uniref:DUF262 domain-containing protein n=1 Tax=Nocardiopsis sp. JB363 TaxID=1434837 RepID=UPI00097A11E7|nr:DUF262 domain-containing protein [Nocardiopsis sp. JB363]SIO90588.1 hypothetical protein BQ8420_27435 [Nocardiopsis sp. JB363]